MLSMPDCEDEVELVERSWQRVSCGECRRKGAKEGTMKLRISDQSGQADKLFGSKLVGDYRRLQGQRDTLMKELGLSGARAAGEQGCQAGTRGGRG